jgi:hypothetical protein
MILSFVITYIIFKVEVWLMRLLNAMVSTILNEMNESVQTMTKLKIILQKSDIHVV